jgi:hypothetical protein
MTIASFSIKSNSSDRELIFYGVRENHFIAELSGSEFRVIREVYSFTDPYGMPKLFNRLAAFQGPWSGSENWARLRGSLRFPLHALA